MESTEDVQWKLAVCPSCEVRCMMPEANKVCLECERAGRSTSLSLEDLRWIISYRDPASFVRAAWMLASEDTNAATGIDVRTGMVAIQRWGAGEEMPPEDNVIILAVCPAHRKAELPGFIMAEGEGLLSDEAAEELACKMTVRAALGDGGERFWNSVDEQLRERSRK